MVHRLAFLAILILGCGAKEPAKSAAPAETPSPKTETAQEAAPPPPTKREAPPTPAGPASPDDVREVLQAVIDDEALTPYLKLQQPNRFPLRVSGRGLPKDLQLMKATKP